LIAALILAAWLIISLATLALFAGATINEARAGNCKRETERHSAIDRETARAIGIGGGADLLHGERN
jgi:hypothetical protein